MNESEMKKEPLLKTPLSVYTFCHKGDGVEELYKRLYSLLCRNVDNPLSDGLDIPVYHITGDDDWIPTPIASSSEKKVFLLFLDSNMCASVKWKEYVNNLVTTQNHDTLIVGVKLSKYSLSFNGDIAERQFIVVDNEHELEIPQLMESDNWDIFTTLIFDLLIRFISGMEGQRQIKIFISHSKKDENRKGEMAAQEVYGFLSSDTKLASFFDVHDILDGYRFSEQIKENVRQSALLVLFTDTYSSREWCRIEVLAAKENRVPILVVFMVESMVDRMFPYIGNIPCTTFDRNWRQVINLLLRTMLDYEVETKLLSQLQDKNTEYLPYPPEAHSMSLLRKETTLLFYPEPPLGNEELHVLSNLGERFKSPILFGTPMNYLTSSINLHQQKVGISISETEDLIQRGIGSAMFKDLAVELTRHLLKANGLVVYGGDLRANGYTELFKELSNQYGQQEKAGTDIKYVYNYLSWPIYNTLTKEQKAEYLNSRIELINAEPGPSVREEEKKQYLNPLEEENNFKWADSLRTMRNQMSVNTSARIIVGGKINSFRGFMPGIIEEFCVSVTHKHPIYLIGGLGGATMLITQIIERKKQSKELLTTLLSDERYKRFYDWCQEHNQPIDYAVLDRITWQDLNNGLSEEENRVLTHSVDIMEIISLVLKGLSISSCQNK